jgi:hypothetical protein
MAEDFEDVIVIERGAPLVATLPRMLGLILGSAALAVGLGYAYLSITHAKHAGTQIPKTLADIAVPIGLAVVLLALLIVVMLRAEESRLQRELRTARTGTPLIRGLILSRRQKMPLLIRLLSTTLGNAAVLVAEGDRGVALDVLAQNSALMKGGRLSLLQQVIDADVERALGTPVALERAIQRLSAMDRIGNREADRYKTHVLVKAILGKADLDAAEKVIPGIEASPDEEERLYAVWLRTWFEIEGGTASEGELRLAALLARSQGADELVKKLDEKIAAVAVAS